MLTTAIYHQSNIWLHQMNENVIGLIGVKWINASKYRNLQAGTMNCKWHAAFTAFSPAKALVGGCQSLYLL